jgi:hypothetical protein
MRPPSPARFYAVIGLHPPYTLVILAATVGVGVWTTSVSPGELDSGLGMLLFVQMFLASSGFLPRARRGHFDPLLVGGDRTSAVVWHWIMSAAPGGVGWTCLAGVGYLLGSPVALSAFVGGRAVALFIVSALAWTVGFTVARGAAGVVWMAALLGILLRRVDLLAPAATAPATSETVFRHAVALMLCPFLLIGNQHLVAPFAICAAALLSALPLLAVWRLSGRLDIYLVDRA